MIKKLLIALSITALITTVGCTKNDTAKNEGNKNKTDVEDSKGGEVILPQFSDLKEGEEIATLKTNMGDIKLRFFPQYAPSAVENFLTHAKNDYYDGVTFHRVINDFMIQGGDPKGTGEGGESIWKNNFEDEYTPALRNFRGALSMAKTQAPHSNGSQFFIVQSKKAPQEYLEYFKQIHGKYMEAAIKKYEEVGGVPQLDNGYTVFGHVIEGMDIVDKIAAVETVEKDKPAEDVIIKDIVVEEYKKGA